MQSLNNKIIIAAAGGRKTTHVIEEALNQPRNNNILITTYTLENVDQIRTYIIEKNGCVPSNIEITTWFKFLLTHGVRPYQNYASIGLRIKSIDFDSIPPRYIPKTNLSYYINKAKNIYRDRVADFVFNINRISKGLVVQRLQKIYRQIYIDEMQDLSGWDFNFIEELIKSSINITLVGDPRQTTYSTTNSSKNKGIAGCNMLTWIEELIKKDLCNLEERTDCYRCNQEICDFADKLYPELKKTISVKVKETIHDGIYFLKTEEEVADYVATHEPVILRWDKDSYTMNFRAINIGISKGKSYPRVLIFPTSTMWAYLENGDSTKLKQATKSKLYVAITRARYSVAFALVKTPKNIPKEVPLI